MRGSTDPQLAMLTSVSTEDLIPADHPIRKIGVVVDAVLAELDPVFSTPPIQETVRRASRDTELHGRTIREGDYIAVNYASANRDGAQFEHPDACIIDRPSNRHVTFGHGRHKCIGAPHARMELRVVREELLRRTSAIELDGANVAGLASQFGGFSELRVH